MAAGKLKAIQALRGIAVLGVVAFHSLTIEKKYSNGDSFLPTLFQIGQSGVDLFFVISGFVMITVSHNRFGSANQALRFLWNRVTRIYPTYWFYFFVTLGIFLLRPDLVNASQGNQADLWSSFFLTPSERLPLVMVAWSLIHELWFYMVFAILIFFNEKILVPALVIWLMIVLFVNLFIDTPSNFAWLRIAFHAYAAEFILGALAAILLRSDCSRSLSQKRSWLLLSLSIFGLALAFSSTLLDSQNLDRALAFGASYSGVVITLVRLEHLGKIKIPQLFEGIGDISYSIYLSHILVLSAIGRIWKTLGPVQNNLVDDFFFWPIAIVAVISSGVIGYRLIEQPASSISHKFAHRLFSDLKSRIIS